MCKCTQSEDHFDARQFLMSSRGQEGTFKAFRRTWFEPAGTRTRVRVPDGTAARQGSDLVQRASLQFLGVS